MPGNRSVEHFLWVDIALTVHILLGIVWVYLGRRSCQHREERKEAGQAQAEHRRVTGGLVRGRARVMRHQLAAYGREEGWPPRRGGGVLRTGLPGLAEAL